MTGTTSVLVDASSTMIMQSVLKLQPQPSDAILSIPPSPTTPSHRRAMTAGQLTPVPAVIVAGSHRSASSTDDESRSTSSSPSLHELIDDASSESRGSSSASSYSSVSDEPSKEPAGKKRRVNLFSGVDSQQSDDQEVSSSEEENHKLGGQQSLPNHVNQPLASNAALTVIHCGLVGADGKRQYRQASDFFSSVIPLGRDGSATVAQNLVNVYTAVSDSHRRILYCCGDLAKRFESSSDSKRMNKVGMWMSRRKHQDGVFQASAILHKEQGPSSRIGLKTSGYFFTREIAELYQQHVLNTRLRMENNLLPGGGYALSVKPIGEATLARHHSMAQAQQSRSASSSIDSSSSGGSRMSSSDASSMLQVMSSVVATEAEDIEQARLEQRRIKERMRRKRKKEELMQAALAEQEQLSRMAIDKKEQQAEQESSMSDIPQLTHHRQVVQSHHVPTYAASVMSVQPQQPQQVRMVQVPQQQMTFQPQPQPQPSFQIIKSQEDVERDARLKEEVHRQADFQQQILAQQTQIQAQQEAAQRAMWQYTHPQQQQQYVYYQQAPQSVNSSTEPQQQQQQQPMYVQYAYSMPPQ